MYRTLLTIALLACTATAAIAEDVTYTKDIKALVDKHCVKCHGAASAPEYYAFKKDKDAWIAKGQGMRMDTYSHLIFYTAWPDTGALMRRLDDGANGKEGKPGNMYKYLGETDAERQANLKLFRSWVGKWVVKKWPEVTKEDLDGITVKY